MIQSYEIPEWNARNFPNHTKSVERCVKLVMETFGRVCGSKARDRVIRTPLKSLTEMSKFDRKTKFNLVSKN